MALTGTERLLVVALVALCIVTLALAAAVLQWHRWSTLREARVQRDSHALALEFASFLTGRVDSAMLRQAVAAASASVFWAALETFADNVAGEEWARLSAVLRDLDHVARERVTLAHGRAWRRALAARHLGMLDDPSNREPLRRAMTGGPLTVTLTAALALARMQDHAALVWLLDHPEALERLSRHQLAALIKGFGASALPTLRFGLAAADFSRPSGLAAIDTLGLWKDAESRLPLEELLGTGSLEVRVAAARALGSIAAPESAPALSAALRDTAWQVRAQAARALGGSRAVSAIAVLVPCLRDTSWWVRRNSAYALGALGVAGKAQLRWIAARSDDPFARTAAEEVLQALEWDRESPGGVTRVG